ncbi:MAG: hypothetical protein AAFZ67_14135 [Planctomycetota bacterium]
MIKTATTALAAAVLLTSAGCYSIGGVPASRDKFHYESHPHMPATVTILDTRTGEAIWSMDVPVGRKLALRFYDSREADDATPNLPALMRWQVVDIGKSASSLRNKVAVPLATARKIDYELREGPEYATDARAAARPSPITTTVSPTGGNGRTDRAPSRDPVTGVPELDPITVDD